MRGIESDGNAQLFRSNAKTIYQVDYAQTEQVGEGNPTKMVRAALSDPDREIWRYSIATGGRIYRGNEIYDLQKRLEQNARVSG